VGFHQGGEPLADAAQQEHDQHDLGQMEQPPPTLGAQKPQHHRDDAGDGFSQVLYLGVEFVGHERT
jgi:hypothetical protein